MIVITKTTEVDAIVSFLEGQVTFFISTLNSLRNWIAFWKNSIFISFIPLF